MNSTSTLLLILAGLAVSGGTAFAGSDDDGSDGRYETERSADTSRVAQLGTGSLSRDADTRAAYLAHWQVTDAVYDHSSRLSLLQHVVPLHDMAAFGRVTSGIIENGLTLDRVDAVFNDADAATPEPHYHFTQRFL